LLPLQLFVVSGLFGAVALGTLKAIIRFTHQQTPDDFRRVETRLTLSDFVPRPRTFFNTRLAAAFRRPFDQ
jgi:hypothetical protein